MDTSSKLQLLSSTRITSGVSFESIVKLNKRYSGVFSKMTLGFECEIAIGQYEGSDLDDGNAIDIDSLRENFNQTFHYTEQEFLNKLEISDVIADFAVKPKYGELPEHLEADIDTVIMDVEKKPFTVAYSTDKTLLFAPDTRNISEMRGFTYNNNYNVMPREAAAIGLRVKKIVEKFFDTYKVDLARARINTPIGGIVKDLEELTLNILQIVQYLKAGKPIAFENNWTVGNIELIQKLKANVWKVGYNITSINRHLYHMRRIVAGLDDNGIMLVPTNTGGLAVVNLNHYDSTGIRSPYIEFDQEAFDEAYEIDKEQELDIQWESELDDARENVSEGNSENTVSAIHKLVLDHVDSKAVSGGYHDVATGDSKGKVTVVESDSSIKPAGAEVVSKVFTGTKDAFEWLDDVFEMIEDYDLETNTSTGLHVNIGTFKPMHKARLDTQYGINLDKPVIDVLKLAILSGDHYLLDQFDRHGNEYARPMASNIIQLKENGFDLKKANQGFIYNGEKINIWDSIRDLNRLFISNQGDRYRTINMQHLVDNGYLEFRIAGGANYHANKEKVHKAVYRYMQLCAIACDPQAYFKEYMTELYQWFVDKHNVNDPIDTRQPRPKTVQDALHILRLWNSKYSVQGLGPFSEYAFNRLKKAVLNNEVINVTDTIEVIAGLDTKYYSKIDSNLLYSFRLILLWVVRNRQNGRQYLADIWNKNRDSIKDDLAPKLYKNKPQWLKFFFTGTGLVGSQTIESSNMDLNDKLSILSNSRVQSARLVYYANRSTPQVLKNGEKAKPKAGYGKVVKTRRATKEEEAQIRKGRWLRVRHDGKKPGDKGAKRSSYRPKLGKMQKVRASVPDDATTYILKVNDDDKSILKILEALQKLGAEGSSRSITIQDDPTSYSIDGDGADKIYDIKTDGGETIQADENSDETTANYSYTLKLKVREFNKYGTIENILENIKAQTDIGLLTTVTITNSNGFISKFQIGGERDSEVSEYGIDTIISIDKTDNPEKAYENPEPEE